MTLNIENPTIHFQHKSSRDIGTEVSNVIATNRLFKPMGLNEKWRKRAQFATDYTRQKYSIGTQNENHMKKSSLSIYEL